MMRTFAAVIVAALAATACGSTTSDLTSPVTAPSSVTLTGTEWVAVEIDGVAVGNTRSTLRFDNETRAAGSTGCNSYFTSVTQTSTALQFGSVGSTKMACETPLMDQETRFLSALDAVRTHRFEGDMLLFVDASGRVRIKFRRP